MKCYYSSNKNVQLLIALFKEHGIKKIIASPGTTNSELVASIQNDSYFEMFSCVDERSAAYMACGLATESGEAVVITCTEATASRNYYPGLTEAFHRKLPILAVTGMHGYTHIGNLEPQVIDRSVSPLDSVRLKVNLPSIKDEKDIEESTLKINKAILELWRNGGGPVHINMPWNDGNFDFTVRELPKVRVIRRFTNTDFLPGIKEGKIAVYIGTHAEFNQDQTVKLDAFCRAWNAVAICEHTSKYYGKYRVQLGLAVIQKAEFEILQDIKLLIHIGEEPGDDAVKRNLYQVEEVWRVNPDGEIRDTFRKLTNVFAMEEEDFFARYASGKEAGNDSYLKQCCGIQNEIMSTLPELPFSSVYAASKIAPSLPKGSVLHLGVSDTIRAWNMFPLPEGVRSSCNSGCRGIDGSVSALVGASLAERGLLYFGVVGDLTFFYDMNALGNHNITENLRLMVVNNNGGSVLRRGGVAQVWLGEEQADKYVVASGHFGNQSSRLMKHFAEDLGFEYLTARNKEEFDSAAIRFLMPEKTGHPMLFEVFTDPQQDMEAFQMMERIIMDTKGKAKDMLKNALGKQGVTIAKRLIK